ncbi:MAG: repressor LexA [Bdellovibrionales bacterium GWB1_55_8]|nr:MAG: repressor LexA [Bdellovibrionales bacterium GWB1_55_8]
MPQNPLTEPQARVLAAIEEEVAHSGRPPTFRELARQLGYSAVGTVQDHVRTLVRKGFLEQDSDHSSRGLRLAHRGGSLDVPILGVVPAGKPIEVIQDRQGSIPIPARWSGDLFALKVRGDSMIEAGILDGDYVIVRKQGHAENGEIVVAMIEGEATVKRLDKRAGKARLLPANPRFSPIDIPRGAENPIQGKVVSVQRFY